MTDKTSLDRRAVRTKMALRDALIRLIEEKGFDKLSVTDLTTYANINRSTFYLHYVDKYDLLEQTEEEIIQDIESIVMQANSLDFADFNSTDNPLPIVVSVFEYLKKNAALMRAVLELEGDFAFISRLRKAVEQNLKLGFLEGLRAEKFLVPSEYLISYATSAHFGVIQTWLQKGCVETPHQMALIISKITLYGPLQMTGIKIPAA